MHRTAVLDVLPSAAEAPTAAPAVPAAAAPTAAAPATAAPSEAVAPTAAPAVPTAASSAAAGFPGFSQWMESPASVVYAIRTFVSNATDDLEKRLYIATELVRLGVSQVRCTRYWYAPLLVDGTPIGVYSVDTREQVVGSDEIAAFMAERKRVDEENAKARMTRAIRNYLRDNVRSSPATAAEADAALLGALQTLVRGGPDDALDAAIEAVIAVARASSLAKA